LTGPQTVLLEYDEILEPLALSTGTPKDASRTLQTVYLRIRSNAVSDLVTVKTRDLVPLTVQLKYLVRFDGDQQGWFNVDNYIQYLCDHLRSLIGNQVRGIGVLEFYFSAATLLRDLVLGAKGADGSRPLRHFPENGMSVYDLEVIRISIDDARINELLHQSQQENLLNTIELERQTRLHLLTAGQEQAKRQIEQERAATQALTNRLLLEIGESQARLGMAEIQSHTERERARADGSLAVQELENRVASLRLEERKAQLENETHFAQVALEQRIRETDAKARQLAEQMAAIQPALVEALTAIASTGTLQTLAQHLAPLSLVRDESLAATLEQMFRDTPMAGLLANLRHLGKGRLLEGTDQPHETKS
jgi:major vault protein